MDPLIIHSADGMELTVLAGQGATGGSATLHLRELFGSMHSELGLEGRFDRAALETLRDELDRLLAAG
jgi:hypothetical protein